MKYDIPVTCMLYVLWGMHLKDINKSNQIIYLTEIVSLRTMFTDWWLWFTWNKALVCGRDGGGSGTELFTLFALSNTLDSAYIWSRSTTKLVQEQWRIHDLVEGGGGVNCPKQGLSPCSRHEVASGGWVRVSPLPHLEENGNQEMLRGLLKYTKIRIL